MATMDGAYSNLTCEHHKKNLGRHWGVGDILPFLLEVTKRLKWHSQQTYDAQHPETVVNLGLEVFPLGISHSKTRRHPAFCSETT